jgi:parallel beta-helix repeat protein
MNPCRTCKAQCFALSVCLIIAALSLPPAVVRSANLLVTSVASNGPGTFRQRMLEAQSGDRITFSTAVFPPSNPGVIYVKSPLPTLNRNGITIDASNAGVILDGSQSSAGTNGLIIQANTCVIQGLTIQHFSGNGLSVNPGVSGCLIGGDRSVGSGPNGQGNSIVANYATGIEIHNAAANTLRGNYIGIDLSGQYAMGNTLSGIALWDGARNNTIGSTISSERNVIGGNGNNGIWIGGPGSNGNIIIGNYLGTRADGMGAVPNRQSGVSIVAGASYNQIGGTALNESNLISGNSDDGIYVADASTIGNRIVGNLIGPNHLGTAIIGQGFDGIVITTGANQNSIGNGTPAGRNIISGNSHDGVCFTGNDTYGNTVQGNYIGTNVSGTAALPNGVHGVELTQNTHDNLVGGNRLLGEGNVLSGNQNHGLEMTMGAHHNTASGNLIGPDATGSYSLGYQPYGGSDIADGAHDNIIGGLIPGTGNQISGNGMDGIAFFDNTTNGTNDNQVLGNLIGLTLNGDSALPNGGPGIYHVLGAARTRIENNTVSGNQGNGIQLSGSSAMSVTVVGNRVGTDLTGTIAIPNGGYGLFISEGSHAHLIENNTISGNGSGGVILNNNGGLPPYGSTVRNNRIGLSADGVSGLGNSGSGLSLVDAANANTIGPGNTLAFNAGNGIRAEACAGNTLTQNSIYSNTLSGISSSCAAPPTINAVWLGTDETITGTAEANAHLEIFVDDDDEGRQYVGSTTANGSGIFSYTQPGGFPGPNVTATSTEVNGNTSEFSAPKHLAWTILLYLNGDNDLDESLRDTFANLIAAGPSPRANVLVLQDAPTTTLVYSNTSLYDLTSGQAISLSVTFSPTQTVPGELDMGDGQTLINFAAWGRSYYPARHTLLSIVDHGGGWAPGLESYPDGTVLYRHHGWLAGNSGLSWDFTNGYDYLTSPMLKQALATIANNGVKPIDVVFYDVCLMGMMEVAYQIKDYASYFVSSQNMGWAPTGADNRYVRIVHNLGSATTAQQMAELVVQSYADSMPPHEHPFTIAAIDVGQLPAVTSAINQLGLTISQTLSSAAHAEALHDVYTSTQKIDYDGDFQIEPATDGFVDLYDFAIQAAQRYTEPAIISAAQAVTASLENAIVAERHQSDTPWMAPDRYWDLDRVHGLSIFLPLGEDLELSYVITETSPITPGLVLSRNLHLREMYTSDQLQFVGATAWKALIDDYYQVVALPVPTTTVTDHVPGLQIPDVTPPQSWLDVQGQLTPGRTITVTWTAVDSQTNVVSATLWHQVAGGSWHSVATQEGTAGSFNYTLPFTCKDTLAVRAVDVAGNVEAVQHETNNVVVTITPCLYFPILARGARFY